MPGLVSPKSKAAKPALMYRSAGVIEIDGVNATGVQHLREVHKDCAGVAFILKRRCAQENLIDLQRVSQIKLDSHIVFEHLEANGVLAADEFLFRINADIKMVEEQVIVGAIRPISAAQDVKPRRLAMSARTQRHWRWRRRWAGSLGVASEKGPSNNDQYERAFCQQRASAASQMCIHVFSTIAARLESV